MATYRQRQQRKQQLAPKRQEAKQARQLAMRKAARIRREQGVESLGKFEPNIPSSEQIERSTEKQLNSWMQRSEHFRSRDVQYTAIGRDKTLVPQQEWHRYSRVQQRQQREARKAFQQFEDVFIPSLNQTIKERAEQMKGPRQQQLEPLYGRPRTDLTPDQVTSPEALKTLGDHAQSLNYGTEERRTRDLAMKALDQMQPYFDKADDKELMQQIRELRNDQFYALWAIRDFGDDIGRYYFSLKAIQSDDVAADKASVEQQTRATDRKNLQGLIDAVKQIPSPEERKKMEQEKQKKQRKK